MPQPKSSKTSSSSSRRTGRSSGSASNRAKSSAKSTAKSTKSAAKSSKSTAKGATKNARSTTRKQQSSARSAQRAATRRDEPSQVGLNALRELLAKGATASLDLVLLTGGRVQEVMDEAVERGRLTRDDAQRLVDEILTRGRKQTEDILADMDTLLGKGRGQLERATRRVIPGGDRVVREADRARRVAGLPPTFPILNYDDLTAAQITNRIGDLSPAELRKVRDYERRHGNRKSVLGAIEKKLG